MRMRSAYFLRYLLSYLLTRYLVLDANTTSESSDIPSLVM